MINFKKERTDERIIESFKNIHNNNSGLKFVILFLFSFLFIVVVFIIIGLSTNNHKDEVFKNKSYERKIENLESKILSMKLDNLNKVNELFVINRFNEQKQLDDLKKASEIPRFQEKQVESIDNQEMISLRQKIRDIDKLYSPLQSHELQKSENSIELLDDNNEDNIIDNIIKLKQELKKQKLKLVSVSKE